MHTKVWWQVELEIIVATVLGDALTTILKEMGILVWNFEFVIFNVNLNSIYNYEVV